MYYRDHFIPKIISLIESYLAALRAAIAYRYCTIKSYNGKSRRGSINSRVYSMNLLRHIGTNCACTHAYILPVSTMLQDNVMQLSEFLLADYQFSSVRDTDRKCGRFTRCSISSFVTAGLWLRSGFRGGRVSETKGNALAREDRVKAVVIAVCSSTGCHQVLWEKCYRGVQRQTPAPLFSWTFVETCIACLYSNQNQLSC